ncbi:hypothetical protein AAIH70_11765 [Neorhizobium sp. BT27B]|uniref:hypothetical protein n=1 Tax=Neorhizobium sp. BT27B TaxID=3142625 RepID=UPI003D2D2B12
MKRTVIGNLFGTPGMYVSQPGDDLDNPQRSLLLDSRFTMLEIHASGIVGMNRDGPINAQYTYYQTVYFPALGYVPKVDTFLLDNASDVITYFSWPARLVNGRYANDYEQSVSDGELFVRYYIGGGQGAIQSSMGYVIYRDPA